MPYKFFKEQWESIQKISNNEKKNQIIINNKEHPETSWVLFLLILEKNMIIVLLEFDGKLKIH